MVSCCSPCLKLGEELGKKLLGPNKRIDEGATYGQVIGQGLAKSAHQATSRLR